MYIYIYIYICVVKNRGAKLEYNILADFLHILVPPYMEKMSANFKGNQYFHG